MATESSSDEVPGTPPQKVRKLIGGLSGSRKLKKDSKNTVQVSTKIKPSSTSSAIEIPQVPTCKNSSDITKSDSSLHDPEELGEDISETSSELSPLRPLYSGSPHFPGDAQDLWEMDYWSFLSSSSSDSSLPSTSSVALLIPLGSPSSQTESPTSSQTNFPTSSKTSSPKKQ